MLRTSSSALALLALSNPALAAGCASPNEVAALKTAVIQQELMVAALQCRETGAYNRFVIEYRNELQSSDANLKAFFVRRGGEHGEAGYDAFKTKAANLSALQQARNARTFCADARALFWAAGNHQGSLMSFVEARSGIDVGNICVESRPMRPVLSDTQVRPERAPAFIRTADAGIHPEIAVGGVPDHSMPAMPHRRESRDSVAPPPRAAVRDGLVAQEGENAARGSHVTANGEDVPRPRDYEPRDRDDDKSPAFVRAADARSHPVEPAVSGVPDHYIPAVPYQRDSVAPPPRAVARENDSDVAQDASDARGSYATANGQEEPPAYYRPRNRIEDHEDYEERAHREQAYYPPPLAGIPLSRWQQQGWQWQAWREYPPPRYGMYPRYPYRGW